MIMSLKNDYQRRFLCLFRAILVSRGQGVTLENLEKRYTTISNSTV